jgi:3-oxoacyl-[acyl-carrier-protein] synthase III
MSEWHKSQFAFLPVTAGWFAAKDDDVSNSTNEATAVMAGRAVKRVLEAAAVRQHGLNTVVVFTAEARLGLG